jgi:hypothetical protein
LLRPAPFLGGQLELFSLEMLPSVVKRSADGFQTILVACAQSAVKLRAFPGSALLTSIVSAVHAAFN